MAFPWGIACRSLPVSFYQELLPKRLALLSGLCLPVELEGKCIALYGNHNVSWSFIALLEPDFSAHSYCPWEMLSCDWGPCPYFLTFLSSVPEMKNQIQKTWFLTLPTWNVEAALHPFLSTDFNVFTALSIQCCIQQLPSWMSLLPVSLLLSSVGLSPSFLSQTLLMVLTQMHKSAQPCLCICLLVDEFSAPLSNILTLRKLFTCFKLFITTLTVEKTNSEIKVSTLLPSREGKMSVNYEP